MPSVLVSTEIVIGLLLVIALIVLGATYLRRRYIAGGQQLTLCGYRASGSDRWHLGLMRLAHPDAGDVYGRSKLLGEVDAPNAVTLRTSMIGHELGGAYGLLMRAFDAFMAAIDERLSALERRAADVVLEE